VLHEDYPFNFGAKGNFGFDLIKNSVSLFQHYQKERVFIEKLSAPYNDCLEDVDSFGQNKTIINYMKRLEKSYSQNECYRICSHLYVLEESNCNCNTTFENFENDCNISEALNLII
jgi:hypothetical protein